jgi:hypothetical protein
MAVPGPFNPTLQQRNQQLMNGVGDDVNMDKKPLMQTAIVNNGRKVSRPGQPMGMPQQATAAQLAGLKQQQQAAQQQQQQNAQQQQRQVCSFFCWKLTVSGRSRSQRCKPCNRSSQ